MTLAAARRARDVAKLSKAEGTDPVIAKKTAKLMRGMNQGDSFKAVTLEWFKRQQPQWSPSHGQRVLRRFERDLFPHLGERPLSTIRPPELLAVLRKIEQRGAIETADRALQDCGQVWRYGVAPSRVERDICADLKGALTPYRNKHFAAITDPEEFGKLIRAIRAYRGGPFVRAALQLAPLLQPASPVPADQARRLPPPVGCCAAIRAHLQRDPVS